MIAVSGVIRSLRKDKYNCVRLSAFNSQRHRVGYQSNENDCITISMQNVSSIHGLNPKIREALQSLQ